MGAHGRLRSIRLGMFSSVLNETIQPLFQLGYTLLIFTLQSPVAAQNSCSNRKNRLFRRVPSRARVHVEMILNMMQIYVVNWLGVERRLLNTSCLWTWNATTLVESACLEAFDGSGGESNHFPMFSTWSVKSKVHSAKAWMALMLYNQSSQEEVSPVVRRAQRLLPSTS